MDNNTIPQAGTAWRKSSYSGDRGGECIECAARGPLQWAKSSYSSDQGGNCLEVAAPFPHIAVRDSKNPAGPTLTLLPATFSTFVQWAGVTTAE